MSWRRARRALLAGASATLLLGAAATGPAMADAGHDMPGASPNAETHGDAETRSYWDSVGGEPYHPTGKVRTYYIGADEVVWNYAPSGRDEITGGPYPAGSRPFVEPGPGRIGTRAVKCIYRGYTDDSFRTLEQRPAQEAYLGILGPVIRAEVGDTIKVVFRNGCRIADSVHPHGVFYTKANEGTPYADNTSGQDKLDDAVPTGGRHIYTWLVPDRAGPGPHEGSSVMWMYHSHTDEVSDTTAGLMGPMVITARGKARPDGSPADVDRELFHLFEVFKEDRSPYLRENLRRFARPPSTATRAPDGTNSRYSMNGYIFGNGPVATVKKGERVRWYTMGMGGESDLHTPHWHGNSAVVNGMRMDTVGLLPGTMATADMVPDNEGIWMFHCHVNEHITGGMTARYEVLTEGAVSAFATGSPSKRPSPSAMPVPSGGVGAGEGGIRESLPSIPIITAGVALLVVMAGGTVFSRLRRSASR